MTAPGNTPATDDLWAELELGYVTLTDTGRTAAAG